MSRFHFQYSPIAAALCAISSSLMIALAPATLMAANVSWTGNASDNQWDSSENWSGGTKPGVSDNALLNNGATALINDDQSLGGIYVGNTGSATLNIHDGAQVTSGIGRLGNYAGSRGEASIDASSQWAIGGQLHVGNNGEGLLNVNGGMLSSSSSYLGNGAGSSGTLNVNAGGQWDIGGDLRVGARGNGLLNISGEGSQVVSGITYLGEYAGSSGEVKISAGGQWDSGKLYVGLKGEGRVEIDNGVLNSSDTASIGDRVGSTGVVEVSGGQWNHSGRIVVGNSGNGNLQISDNGIVNSNQAVLGNLASAADQPPGSGVANITSGGQWLNSGRFTVGMYGSGILNVGPGGRVESDVMLIGDSGDAVGEVSVREGGALVTYSDLYVGNHGIGSLVVDNASLTTGMVNIGNYDDGKGSVSVSNDGRWDSTGEHLHVGHNGNGSLSIASGGAVSSVNGVLGDGARGSGNVTVSDGRWDNRETLRVGNYGTGEMLIQAGGVVTNTDSSIAHHIGSSGSVTVESGATWNNSGALHAGYNGLGQLTVTGDGQVTSAGATLGAGETGDGRILLTDQANWRNDGRLFIGGGGNGSLLMRDDAYMSSDEAFIASYRQEASGHVGLSGNARWDNAGQLRVANEGNGSLSIDDNATLSTGDLYVAYDRTASGTLSLNSGLLETGSLRGGQGNARFEFNGGLLRAMRDEQHFLTGFETVSLGAQGGRIDSNGHSIIAFSPFTGIGGVTKEGEGSLTLASINSYTGDTRIKSGELLLAVRDAVASSGRVSVEQGTLASLTDQTFQRLESAAGSYLDMHGNNLSVVSGDLHGSHSNIHTVNKIGSGVLALNTGNALTGTDTFNLNDGTVTANSDQTLKHLNTASGTRFELPDHRLTLAEGRLTGTGTIAGTLNLASGSSVAPGHGVGTGMLNVEGHMSFSSDSHYDVETNPGDLTDSDRISITGTADLGGATVRQVGYAGNYPAVGEWTILTATDGLGGTHFNSEVEEYYAFLDSFLRYGNDASGDWVNLVLARNDVELPSYAETPNQNETANGLASLDLSSPIYNGVLGLTENRDIAGVYDQLSGEGHASLTSALLDYDRYFSRSLRNRLVLDDSFPNGYPLWITVESYDSTNDSSHNTAGTRLQGSLITFGVEQRLGDWTSGIAFRYGNHDFSADHRYYDADIDSFGLGLYTGRAIDQWRLKFGVTYSRHEVDSRRQVVEPVLQQRLKSDYDVETMQTFAEVGWHQPLSQVLTVEPYIGATWNQAKTGSFHEKGGNAALSASREHQDNFGSTLGARWMYRFAENSALEVDANWQHLYGERTPSKDFAFRGSANFPIDGAPMSRDALGLRIGASTELARQLNLRGGYEGLYGNDSTSHGGYITLEYQF